MLEHSLAKSFNESADHIAVLDDHANIIFVNNAWKEFAQANGYSGKSFEGQNYLRVCQRGIDYNAKGADQAYQAVHDALHGSQPKSALKFGCHAPPELRWFDCNVSQLDHGKTGAAVIIRWKKTSQQLHASATTQKYGRCSLCGIELPLVEPKPEEIELAKSWVCTFCGNRFRALIDETRFAEFGANVRQVED